MSCLSRPRLSRLAILVALFLGLSIRTAHAQRCSTCLPGPQCCPSPLAPSVTPTTPSPFATPPQTPALTEAPMPGPVTTAALGDSMASFGPGYLDNPIPFTHFRFRYDAAFRNNRPDRAEFFYPQCGSPNSIGIIDSRVDYQDLRAYMEFAPADWLSVFVEMPYRILNPTLNPNANGYADMNTGVKVALYRTEHSIVTLQGRLYIPTGDSNSGLGNDHGTIEPSLVFATGLSDRLVLFGQVGDWIPTGGTNFSGNIVSYGAGVSYTVVETSNLRVAPVVEVLGWTVVYGRQFEFGSGIISDAAGDTIVNGKFGVRIGFGPDRGNSLLSNSDLYVGYGRALTGEVWYKDIIRAEYRLQF
jgi:hypothetical protein